MKTTVTWVFVGVLVLLGGQPDAAGAGGHFAADKRSSLQQARVVDRYVALGDSYTAGAGIPPASPSGCFRSARNYPARVAERLSRRTEVVDVSCGAATTSNAESAQTTFASNPPQLSQVDARADLVTVSLGVNDAGFASLFSQCPALAAYDPMGAPCRASFQTPTGDLLLAGVHAVRERLARVLEEVQTRAPRAQVLLVGYPQPVPESGTCAQLPLAAGDYAYAREFFVALDASMRLAARDAGATYIDVLTASRGHDICAGRDAWVLGAGPSGRTAPYHPFAREQRAVAALVVDAVKSAR
ncbi:SGNH/GDSL hydrolase family protein [Nocardioides halotolerans]|uniref:SGNH/GDSL hydrolase family protein n=1 Tax=Nocardioides halotolerans TaxID=433660 RepID=UPI0003FE354F|nr:SGNH/GDSL hydrolase family protein [Nocardioides halotolerans]